MSSVRGMPHNRPISIDQLQRKLNLARVTRCLADHSEAGVAKDGSGGTVHLKRVGRKTHGNDIEDVEELRSELEIHALGATFPATNGRVLDEREIEVIERRSSKRISSQGAEAALVGARSVG